MCQISCSKSNVLNEIFSIGNYIQYLTPFISLNFSMRKKIIMNNYKKRYRKIGKRL